MIKIINKTFSFLVIFMLLLTFYPGSAIADDIEIISDEKVIQVASGVNFYLALKSDGTVWAWGSNQDGQLGNGTIDKDLYYSYYKIPSKVVNLDGVISIAASSFSAVALKKDGTVWTWGNNVSGQLGNGTFENSGIPVQVITSSGAPLTDIVSISTTSGAGGVMALKKDGTVWSWGFNYYGDLGSKIKYPTRECTTALCINIRHEDSDIDEIKDGINYWVDNTDGI